MSYMFRRMGVVSIPFLIVASILAYWYIWFIPIVLITVFIFFFSWVMFCIITGIVLLLAAGWLGFWFGSK